MDTEDEWIKKTPTWVVVLVGIALTTFVACSLFYRHQLVTALQAHPRYTIGYVMGTGYAVSASSHSITFFTYKVGDRTFRTSSSGDLPAGCTRCLVKYAADDPQKFEFYSRLCIPDSIANAPAQWWQKPPFAVAADLE
jgi:hypothetical protein